MLFDEVETASQRMLSVNSVPSLDSLPHAYGGRDLHESQDLTALASAVRMVVDAGAYCVALPTSSLQQLAAAAKAVHSQWRGIALLSCSPISPIYGAPAAKDLTFAFDLMGDRGDEVVLHLEAKQLSQSPSSDERLVRFLSSCALAERDASIAITALEGPCLHDLDAQMLEVERRFQQGIRDAELVRVAEAAEAREQERLNAGIEESYAADRAAWDFLSDA